MVRRAALPVVLLVALPAVVAAEEPRTPARREVMGSVVQNLAYIEDALKWGAALVEDARDEKDLSKLVCMDEKLHAMRQLASVAKQANAEMLSSMADDSSVAMNANATKIAIARSRVELLLDEADRCLGSLVYRSGDTTSVEVREPGNLPGANKARPDLGVVRRLERPEEHTPMVDPDSAFERTTADR